MSIGILHHEDRARPRQGQGAAASAAGRRLRILYVTPLWHGFDDLVVRGVAEPSGMPAFVRPLRALLQKGHRVDLIAAAEPPLPELRIGPPWLAPVGVELVPWVAHGTGRLRSPVRLLRAIGRAIGRARYDFVYGHGAVGALACLLAGRRKIPCGQRLYGTHLAEETAVRPAAVTALRHPLEYLAFTARKDFLIVTDDGSEGGLVYRRLAWRRRGAFHLWRNGVDFIDDREMPLPPAAAAGPFLFFPARIAAWKRPEVGVRILHRLHALGHREVRLLIAGPISDPGCWQLVRDEAAAGGVDRAVIHLGRLGVTDLAPYYRHCLAVLAPYASNNLGNVVIESLAAGSIVVAPDNGGLEGVIEDGNNGILAATPEVAAARLAELLTVPVRAATLQAAAAATARRLFDSWETRVEREVDLISAAARAT